MLWKFLKNNKDKWQLEKVSILSKQTSSVINLYFICKEKLKFSWICTIINDNITLYFFELHKKMLVN